MNGHLRMICISLSVAALVMTGCARRPALTAVSAPAPTGAAAQIAPPPQPAALPQTTVVVPPPVVALAPPAPAPQPAERPAPKEFAAVPQMADIHFDFDKYNIRPGDARVLDANAQWLKDHADHLVLIEGHCDERGTNEYNQVLGERRAMATLNYLVSRGVQANRITTISYGEERPLCTEHNEGCWSKNRRAHFLVKPM